MASNPTAHGVTFANGTLIVHGEALNFVFPYDGAVGAGTLGELTMTPNAGGWLFWLPAHAGDTAPTIKDAAGNIVPVASIL